MSFNRMLLLFFYEVDKLRESEDMNININDDDDDNLYSLSSDDEEVYKLFFSKFQTFAMLTFLQILLLPMHCHVLHFKK